MISADESGLGSSLQRQVRRKLVPLFAFVLLLLGGFIIWLSLPGKTDQLLNERRELDKTVWKEEVEAQHYEEYFVQLWDDLRAAQNPLAILGQAKFDELQIGEKQDARQLDWGIRTTELGPPIENLDNARFKQRCRELAQQGCRIVQTEWHHSRFEVNEQGQARSTVSIRIDAETSRPRSSRVSITGELLVDWSPDAADQESPRPAKIDASRLTISEREVQPAFEIATALRLRQGGGVSLQNAPACIVYDLDRDGLSDLLIPPVNMVFHNRGNFEFDEHRLLANPLNSEITCSLLADFDRSGRPDLLIAGAGFLVLFRANEHGDFPGAGEYIARIGDQLVYPSALTAGDIDLDGDLDVWLAQYKPAYHFGQMPTPYYDANDGFPSFLLENDGEGNFHDVSEAWGLADKRFRRTYSATLVDLNEDRAPDLVVASDYSGLDIYTNKGNSFKDVTGSLGEDRHSFGMSLTFADYNRDGKTDFYMTGMASTTARRLEALGLGREEFPEHQQKRSLMGYGNRMFFATQDGFQQSALNDQVARTGWSWGSTSFDFDNDGDVDIYVANGHRSNKTAKDYCTRFWTHDIYTGSSDPDPQIVNLFQEVLDKELNTMSWNGFEHNCLLMNEGNGEFRKVGYLLGVAFEFDSRNVVSDDFDGDGKLDLLVVGRREGEQEPTVYLVKNNLENENHWIGFHLRDNQQGHFPTGSKIAIEYSSEKQVRSIVSGDSFCSQHAASVHFGLGNIDQVKKATIVWTDGSMTVIDNPQTDQYHLVDK